MLNSFGAFGFKEVHGFIERQPLVPKGSYIMVSVSRPPPPPRGSPPPDGGGCGWSGVGFWWGVKHRKIKETCRNGSKQRKRIEKHIKMKEDKRNRRKTKETTGRRRKTKEHVRSYLKTEETQGKRNLKSDPSSWGGGVGAERQGTRTLVSYRFVICGLWVLFSRTTKNHDFHVLGNYDVL